MASEGYTPSTDDVLRARLRTTGIEEAFFVFSDFAFHMVDVGGAAGEGGGIAVVAVATTLV